MKEGLERIGQKGEYLDAVIAATALINNSKLITKNMRDFKKVAGLRQSNPH